MGCDQEALSKFTHKAIEHRLSRNYYIWAGTYGNAVLALRLRPEGRSGIPLGRTETERRSGSVLLSMKAYLTLACSYSCNAEFVFDIVSTQ